MKSNLKDYQQEIIDEFIRLSKLREDKLKSIKFKLGYEFKRTKEFEDIIYTNKLD